MKIVTLAAAVLVGAARIATAQTAAEHIAEGDRAHAALDLKSALAHYEAAIAVDPANVDALDKAAYDAVDLGEFDTNKDERNALYKKAEGYARRAVAANPNDAEAHFELSRALGRYALTLGTRDRIKFAKEIRNEALTAVKLNPRHAGALHVLGMWNAEIMRLSGFSRMIAKNFLGGAVFGEANWDNAQRYLEEAVEYDPTRITHHRDLAGVYVDRGLKAKAIEQYEWILRAPVTEYNDQHYKDEAAQRLAKLR
ncbi:MAG TPA: hypothetical protein VHB25_03565 [Gemmatimonadaceae bacterium]|nr:hypothetical protein [Gemmatimonadaceae bacterium]